MAQRPGARGPLWGGAAPQPPAARAWGSLRKAGQDKSLDLVAWPGGGQRSALAAQGCLPIPSRPERQPVVVAGRTLVSPRWPE